MTALLAAFFLAAVPLLTYHALTAYADLPLSFYALGGMVCLWYVIDALHSGRTGDTPGLLVLTGTCAALCAWTKMEGLFFVAAFSAALLLFLLVNRTPLTRGAAFLVPLALITVPWYSFLLCIGVPVSYGEERMLGEVVSKGLHVQVLPVIAEQVLFSANFNIIFPFLFLLMVLGYRSIVRSGLVYLYVAVLGVMVMFLVLYLGTESYRWVMNLTAVNRNILTFVPMLYYVAALTAHRLLQGETIPDSRGMR
jgi:4-amino-4-deoxy-L-arabinose transferase-like glycosyltransferase